MLQHHTSTLPDLNDAYNENTGRGICTIRTKLHFGGEGGGAMTGR